MTKKESKQSFTTLLRQKVEELLKNIPSKDGKIIELNLIGSAILGNEPSHLKNIKFAFFVSDDTKPVFNLFLDKIFTLKSKETCEVTLSPNGKLPKTDLLLTGIAIKNEEQ